MKAAHIHVTIDRLVLRGLTPSQRDGFARGLRGELERLLSDPRLGHSLGNLHLASVRPARLPGAGGAFAIGVRTAQALARNVRG